MAESADSHFILHWLVSGLAVFLTSYFIPGFKVSGFIAACFAALAIGLANAIIWPVLFFINLPINLLTLGLFTFVVNGATLKMTAALMPGFRIESWFSAIFGSVVLSIVGLVLHYVLI
jgi:putative membrane protein